MIVIDGLVLFVVETEQELILEQGFCVVVAVIQSVFGCVGIHRVTFMHTALVSLF